MKYLVVLASFLILITALTACGTQFRPIEVVGVVGPIPPFNPGGPTVRITLKNTGSESVTQLKATLELEKSYEYNFEINASDPLLTGGSIFAQQTLIGGGISSETSYPLKISATLQSGSIIAYTVQVMIGTPPPAN